MFIWKQYPENFKFLILRILELFTREVCNFLKKQAFFNIFFFFGMFVNKLLTYLNERISQKVKDVLMWNFQRIIFI